MEHIILHVYYHGKAGEAAAFVREMKEQGLQKKVKNEDGNFQYDYFLSTEDADTVLLLEQWRDADALAAHLTRPTMDEIRALKAKHGLETRLERYE